MLKKNKNGRCPFGYVELNGMCVPENQMNQFQFSNEFTSSNGYQPTPTPPPPPPPPTPTPPGPSPGPSPAPDNTEAFLRRAAEVTGGIFGVGVGALEAEQRYQEYLVTERMRINRAARDAEELDRMFTPPEAGEFEFVDIESADVLGRELNLYNAEQPPLTDSMGRLLSDERFLINTDTEEGLVEMTDADIQADIQRMVEEAETGTTMRPQDGQETDPIQARRNKDAEEAAQKEYEERQKAREAEGDTFEGAPEFDDDGGNVEVGEEMGPKNKNQSKFDDDFEKITKPPTDVEPPTQEEIVETIKRQKKESFIPAEDVDAERLADIVARQEAAAQQSAADAEAAGGIPDLIDLAGPNTGPNPIPDIAGEYGGVTAEAVEEAERIIAGAEAAGTIITEAERLSMITRVMEAAAAGDDVAVGSAIMSGLLTEGVASIGAVAAVGVEIAALGALTYGAEKLYNKAEGIVERPDSLDGAAHELTTQEKDYFQSVATQQVRAAEGVYADDAVGAPRRRAPNSPFAPKDSGSGERPTRQSDARNKALYNEMSDAEKKVFDDNYNKMISDEQESINYWNNIPEGTQIENGPDGYVLLPPDTMGGNREVLPGTPQSWIDDFNRQLENDKIPKQQDGIGNLETMAQDEMAAAQLQKDNEMKEVTDYLAYMDQRNEEYLASVGLLETQTAEAQPEPEAEDMPDNA